MLLNQITIPCLEYDAWVAFSVRLGLVQIVDSPTRYARFEGPDGSGATISLHLVEKRPETGVVVYFDQPDRKALDAHVDNLV